MSNISIEVKSRVVPLRGFVVDFDSPSVGVLEPIFNIFAEVEDKRIVIGKERIRLLRKYWYNHIQYLNRLLYQRAKEICVRTPIGWLLPFENVDKLKRLEEEMLKRWKEYDRELREFLKSVPVVLESGDVSKLKLPDHLIKWIRSRYGEDGLRSYVDELVRYMRIVRDYLRQRGVYYEDLINSIPYLPSRFRVKMYPFNISLEEVLEMIPEHAKRYVQSKVDETISIVRKEVAEKTRQELLKIKDVVVSTLQELTAEKLRDLSKAIKKLREVENTVSIIDPDLRKEIQEIEKMVRLMTVKKVDPWQVIDRIDLLTTKIP